MNVKLDANASNCYDFVMQKTHPPPTDAAITAWARLVRAHQRALGIVEQALKEADLPPLSWYDVLLELRRAGEAGLRPTEIEAQLLLAQHNVSRLLGRLEAQGLVRRAPCPEDGRGQVVKIEPAGEALLKQMWPIYAAAIEKAVGSRLTEADAKALAALLGKLMA